MPAAITPLYAADFNCKQAVAGTVNLVPRHTVLPQANLVS